MEQPRGVLTEIVVGWQLHCTASASCDEACHVTYFRHPAHGNRIPLNPFLSSSLTFEGRWAQFDIC
eukprot:815413-Amphidinium_carterae.1